MYSVYFSTPAAPLPANPEQHQRREELHHHLPFPHGAHLAVGQQAVVERRAAAGAHDDGAVRVAAGNARAEEVNKIRKRQKKRSK